MLSISLCLKCGAGLGVVLVRLVLALLEGAEWFGRWALSVAFGDGECLVGSFLFVAGKGIKGSDDIAGAFGVDFGVDLCEKAGSVDDVGESLEEPDDSSHGDDPNGEFSDFLLVVTVKTSHFTVEGELEDSKNHWNWHDKNGSVPANG